MMNDLTKEARARAYEAEMIEGQRMRANALQNIGLSAAHNGNALANAMAGPKYGDKSLNPDRPLTGRARNYLTKWDEGSRCEVIKRYVPMTFKWQETGLDINEFRKSCEEIGE